MVISFPGIQPSYAAWIMLHATVKPEDKCPIQRLDYDRTNLLKNHPPEAEFVNRKHFVILDVKNSVKGRIELYLRLFQTIQI